MGSIQFQVKPHGRIGFVKAVGSILFQVKPRGRIGFAKAVGSILFQVKPRGRIGFAKAVGSITGKKKNQSSSLQSALSVDLENPEVEKIKKDFEMYR